MAPPAHPPTHRSGAGSLPDQMAAPTGLLPPGFSSPSTGPMTGCQPSFGRSFTSWPSWSGWGDPGNLPPENVAPPGTNAPWGGPINGQGFGPWLSPSFIPPWLWGPQYPQSFQPSTRQVATASATTGALPQQSPPGNCAAPPQQSISASVPATVPTGDHPDAVSVFASPRDMDIGEDDESEADSRSVKPQDSISQVGSVVSRPEGATELSYGDTIRSLGKVHPVPDIVGSLAGRPAPKPDSSRAVLRELATPSSEGLVALRPSSMLEAVIQATNNSLRGKEEPKKGEVPDYPSALKPGVFLSASNPRLVPKGRYELLPGAIARDAPTPGEGDRRCSTKAELSSRASIPLSALRQWENMARLGLHIGSTLDHVLGGLASLTKDAPPKDLPTPEETKALASALMRVLSEGIEHATGLFSRLQTNCLLARRDVVLSSSALSERDRSTLRALPSNSSEFFGPEAAALFSAREKVRQQDALERMVLTPSKSSGQKRKYFGGQTSDQSKKHKPSTVPQPSQPRPPATPRSSFFFSKKKRLPRSQGAASSRQHPQ